MTSSVRPVRIQLSRKKGWRMPPNTVKVDRSTRWGNPFVVGETYPVIEEGNADAILAEEKCLSAAEAVSMFRSWVSSEHGWDQEQIDVLSGKNLACWCRPGDPCHADVLLELANKPESA